MAVARTAVTAFITFCLFHGVGCHEDPVVMEMQDRIDKLQAEVESLQVELLQAQRHSSDEHPGRGPISQDFVTNIRTGHIVRSLSGVNESHHGDGEGHESHDQETLIFLFGTVTIGTIVLQLTTIPALHSLQFTVLLFVLGVGCGTLAEHGALQSFPMLRRSYMAWVDLDPHLLLFTFLPPLLCGDAMTIDTHIARRCAGQCFLLAGPGVMIGALLTTLVVHKVLPYGWDIWTSLTVGSILAATDPVAVVSLLKELGASPVLTILIQGESLLNDGIAIVLFTVAYKIAGGETYTMGQLLVFVIKSTLVAGCLGGAIGFFFYMWIKRSSDKLCHSNALIQISLTLVCAYWSFIIAEGVFHTSGVLSTVTAAFVLAHKMWPVLVERSTMLHIWHVIETIGNILVFFLAGVLTGRAMQIIPFEDYISLVVLYVAVTFIRFFVLLLFYPILNRIGEHVSLADVVIMTWGGLRGMVGLALGILVQKDLAGGKLSQTDGDRILFLVGSVAALTMIVNATTCPALTRLLGITRAPEARNVLMRNVAQRARSHIMESLETLMSSTQASKACSPALVKELVGHLMDSAQGTAHPDGHAWSSEASVRSACGIVPNGDEVSTKVYKTIDSSSKTVTFETTRILEGIPSATSSRSASSLAKVVPNDEGVRMVQPPLNVKTKPMRMSTSSQESLSTVGLHGYKHSLHSKLFGDPELPHVEYLWTHFNEAKENLLKTGSQIVTFKFGKQLVAIKAMLSAQAIDRDHIEVVREVFLETVRANYWEQLNEGRFMVGSSEPAILFNSVNIAKEHCSAKLMDWEVLKKDICFAKAKSTFNKSHSLENLLKAATAKSKDLLQVMRESKSFPGRCHAWLLYKLQEWRTKRNFRDQAFAIQLINAFIEAQCKAQEQTARYFGAGEDVDSPEEAFVIIESQTQIFEAARMRGIISHEVQLKVNTMWHVHCLAEQYRNFVLEVHETGVLQTKEADALLTPIAKAMRQFNKDRKNIYELIAKKSVKKVKIVDTSQAALVIQRYVKRRKMLQCLNDATVTVVRPLSDLKPSSEGDDTCESPCKDMQDTKSEISELSDPVLLQQPSRPPSRPSITLLQ